MFDSRNLIKLEYDDYFNAFRFYAFHCYMDGIYLTKSDISNIINSNANLLLEGLWASDKVVKKVCLKYQLFGSYEVDMVNQLYDKDKEYFLSHIDELLKKYLIVRDRVIKLNRDLLYDFCFAFEDYYKNEKALNVVMNYIDPYCFSHVSDLICLLQDEEEFRCFKNYDDLLTTAVNRFGDQHKEHLRNLIALKKYDDILYFFKDIQLENHLPKFVESKNNYYFSDTLLELVDAFNNPRLFTTFLAFIFIDYTKGVPIENSIINFETIVKENSNNYYDILDSKIY